MVTDRMRIATAVRQLGSAAFHELCDHLLPQLDQRFAGIQPFGRMIDAAKDRRGQPDSYIRQPDGKYIAIQCTSDQSDKGKLVADLEVLQDSSRCTISNAISVAVLCTASQVPPDVLEECYTTAAKSSWELIIFSLEDISRGLELNPHIAREFGLQLTPAEMTPEIDVLAVTFGASGFSNGMPEPPFFRADLRLRNPTAQLWRVLSVTIVRYDAGTTLLPKPDRCRWLRDGRSLQPAGLELDPGCILELPLLLQTTYDAKGPSDLAPRLKELTAYSVDITVSLYNASGQQFDVPLALSGTYETFKRGLIDNYWAKGVAPKLAEIARGTPSAQI